MPAAVVIIKEQPLSMAAPGSLTIYELDFFNYSQLSYYQIIKKTSNLYSNSGLQTAISTKEMSS